MWLVALQVHDTDAALRCRRRGTPERRQFGQTARSATGRCATKKATDLCSNIWVVPPQAHRCAPHDQAVQATEVDDTGTGL